MERGLTTQRYPILTSYLDKWAQDCPGKIALIQAEQGKQWMYKQFAQQVNHLAEQLWKSELRPGDRLISFLPNNLENVSLMWACWKLGVAFVPLSNLHIAKNAQRVLDLISPKMVVIHSQTAKILHDQNILFDTSPIHWREWQQHKKMIIGLPGLEHLGPYQHSYKKSFFPRRKPWQDIQKEMHSWRPALILYPYTPEDTLAPMILCFEHIHAQIHAISDLTSLDKGLKTLVHPPLQQPESLILSLLLPLKLGGTAVLTNASSVQEWKTLVSRYQVNTLFPRSISLERSLEEKPTKAEWSSLKRIFYPYPKDDAAASSTFFCKKLGGIVMRENGGYMALQHPKYPELFIPLSRISIREPLQESGKDGKELKAGEKGEICIHPPLVHGGFITDEGILSPNTSRDGLFYTGLKGSLYEQEGQTFLKVFEEQTLPLNLPLNPAA